MTEVKVVAYLVPNMPSGEPNLCFEDERGDYGTEDFTPVFEPLVRKADLDAALERVKVLEADARRLDVLEAAPQRDGWIVAKNVGSFTASLGKGQHATRATLRAAIDAAAIAGKGTTP